MNFGADSKLCKYLKQNAHCIANEQPIMHEEGNIVLSYYCKLLQWLQELQVDIRNLHSYELQIVNLYTG